MTGDIQDLKAPAPSTDYRIIDCRCRLTIDGSADYYVDRVTHSLDEALSWIDAARSAGEALSVALVANAADVYPELVRRGVTPDFVS